ncbi:MAG TPA: glycosyltransferase family 4 protein [Myxococcota bacterium]|nr:glycosyltransferase family 4 protein [Myxococcota bacterium]HRY97372.1 glycosyltransferase family 4 protein [Myxococcota bacterium]
MSGALRILHLLAYHLYTGPAEPVLRLARAQRAAGCDARLAIDSLRPGDLAARAAAFGVPLEPGLALSVKAGPILCLRDILALKRVWREGRFDVLHAHRSHDHTLAALARPARAAGRLVRSLHTERALGPGRRWQLRRADGLVCVSRRQRAALLGQGLLAEERVIAVEGAVDAETFGPGPGREALRAELGLAPGAPTAGIVARMKPGRGHELLLEAWARVHARLPSARLVLAGRGELEARLRERAARETWGGSVVFAGYHPDLPRLYRALDLFVLLAPGNDGTCRAALEAMATGVGVLARPRGALAEIVTDGETGRLVWAEGAEALGAALAEALADPARLAVWGARARAEALQRFRLDRQVEAIQGLYEGLLGAT